MRLHFCAIAISQLKDSYLALIQRYVPKLPRASWNLTNMVFNEIGSLVSLAVKLFNCNCLEN